jgi:hypothetical protein
MQLGYIGEAEWCPEASRRVAKQPRRRADRRAGARRRGARKALADLDLISLPLADLDLVSLPLDLEFIHSK